MCFLVADVYLVFLIFIVFIYASRRGCLAAASSPEKQLLLVQNQTTTIEAQKSTGWETLTAHLIANLELHLRVGIFIRNKRGQGLSDHALGSAKRGIIVDREDRHSTVAAIVDDGGFAGKGAVAVDAHVHRIGDEVGKGEDAGGGVVDSLVGGATAAQAGLDEWWGDARVVDQGSNKGGVDAETDS